MHLLLKSFASGLVKSSENIFPCCANPSNDKCFNNLHNDPYFDAPILSSVGGFLLYAISLIIGWAV